MKPWINALLFQIAWFGVVYFTSLGQFGVVSAVCLTTLSLHFAFSSKRQSESILILSTLILGILCDGLLQQLHVLDLYQDHNIQGLIPFWLMFLWALFATTINSSLAWFHNHKVLSSLAGGVGGALSYYAGSQFGIVHFEKFGPVISLSVVAVVWAILTPSLMWLGEKVGRLKDLK